MATSVKEFYQEFMQNVRESSELEATSVEEQVTSYALDYIKGEGASASPEQMLCVSEKPEKTFGYYKITGFDYSEDTGLLDLFTTYCFEGESMADFKKSHVERALNWVLEFFTSCVKGEITYQQFQQSNPDLADAIYTINQEFKKRNITNVRAFIITNGLLKEEYEKINSPIQCEDQEIDYEVNIWDINAIFRSEYASQNAGAINVDLREVYGMPIECIPMLENQNVKSYLAIFPAIILAKVYKDYKGRLLDQNVRTYLGGKVKVNKSMSDTIKNKPEMFFAYNNGISSTSEEVVTQNKEGKVLITNIKNWQIVNGGQTTNTIYNSYINKQDLSNVYISLKISEIKIADDQEKNVMVSEIAKNANSQTQIKDSDLSGNHIYMLNMDKISKSEWTPMNSYRRNTKWFFERMRGQYSMEKGKRTTKKFTSEYPKNQMFAKVDIAKLEMAWADAPYIASLGGEMCFDKFWKGVVLKLNPKVDENYYHRLIAKKIIAEAINDDFKATGRKGYGNIICNYVLAAIALKSRNNFDLDYVWNHQTVNDALKPFIHDAIDIVYKCIIKVSEDGTNATSAAKKIDFWSTVKLRLSDLTLDKALFSVAKDGELTDKELSRLEDFKAIPCSVWESLVVWGNQTKNLSLMERKKIEHMVVSLKAKKDVLYGVADDSLMILQKSYDLGFKK